MGSDKCFIAGYQRRLISISGCGAVCIGLGVAYGAALRINVGAWRRMARALAARQRRKRRYTFNRAQRWRNAFAPFASRRGCAAANAMALVATLYVAAAPRAVSWLLLPGALYL